MCEKKFYIDLVGDYGTGDLAFTEVRNRLYDEFCNGDTDAIVNTISTHPFNTIETGVIVAQIAMNSRLPNHIVYHNCAPRKDDRNARQDNSGEFLAACIINNVLVVGPYSGFSFSFLKNYARVYKLECPAQGSQFRSRDIFPKYIKYLVDRVYDARKGHFDVDVLNEDCRCVECEITDVPDMLEDKVVYIDGYGNCKLYLSDETIKSFSKLDKVRIRVKDKEYVVRVGTGIFGVSDGEFVLAPGSSGWRGDKFFELSLRGGSASKQFDSIVPGTKISIEKV